MCDEVYLTVFNEIYKADKFFDMGLLDSFQMKSNVVIDDAQYRIYEKLRKSKMPLYE